MSHDIITRYIADTLKPQLAAFGIPGMHIQAVAGNAETQMLSCIHHWNDEAFRKALLIIGEEEGSFYYPKASADVRYFVVVTLRNSALESVHSDHYQLADKRLKPENIRAITSAAIEYFANIDFMAMSEQVSSVEYDIYGILAKKHPISWAMLTELANSGAQVIECEYIETSAIPTLNNLKRKSAVSGLFFEEKKSDAMFVVSDGYSLTIDHGLAHILKSIVENEAYYIGDSFKWVSRNIEKLLTVMEYVLGHDLAFITANYLIANGTIERRLKPVKPENDMKAMKRNWLNGSGLTKSHRYWLKAAAEGL